MASLPVLPLVAAYPEKLFPENEMVSADPDTSMACPVPPLVNEDPVIFAMSVRFAEETLVPTKVHPVRVAEF
jgi:hypothetical protein